MQLSLDLVVSTALCHCEGNGPALLLDHCQVLQVLVCVEKELARIQLHQDASHGPNIGLLVPCEVLEDDFGRSVLPCVDYERVALMLICRPSKVDYLDLAADGLAPLATDVH